MQKCVCRRLDCQGTCITTPKLIAVLGATPCQLLQGHARHHSATERADWTRTAFISRCNPPRCCGVLRQGVWCLKPPHPPCPSRPCNARCQRAATSSIISYAHVPQRAAHRLTLRAHMPLPVLHGHLCTPAAAAALELAAWAAARSALPGAARQLSQVCFGCWLEGNGTSDRRVPFTEAWETRASCVWMNVLPVTDQQCQCMVTC